MHNSWSFYNTRDDAALDFPIGGSQAIVDALVRGIKKFGGEVHLSSHCDKIIMENQRAVGISIKHKAGDKEVYAKKGVISAMSVLNTVKVIDDVPKKWK